MKRILFLLVVLSVLFSCSDDDAYTPWAGVFFWINTWDQTMSAGVWTNLSVNYDLQNVGKSALKNVSLEFEITFTNDAVSYARGRLSDLSNGEYKTIVDTFYFGNIGVADVAVFSVGMDDP